MSDTSRPRNVSLLEDSSSLKTRPAIVPPQPGSRAFDVVVSSENSLYMAWQTQLFCVSASTVLRQWPLVVVHENGEPLRPEFRDLAALGCRIVVAPSAARTARGWHYPPRNELWSLQVVGTLTGVDADCILFCEPDMLFVRPFAIPNRLAAEFYGYLCYDDPRVAAVARAYGLAHRIGHLNAHRRIGVPYVIPTSDVTRLAARWIEVLDAFDELQWIDIMYAFGLAIEVEGLDVDVTYVMTDNYRATRPVRSLVHYCYGDENWDKRAFQDRSPFDLPDDALRRGVPGTVLGEIMRQIRVAKPIVRRPPRDPAGGVSRPGACV